MSKKTLAILGLITAVIGLLTAIINFQIAGNKKSTENQTKQEIGDYNNGATQINGSDNDVEVNINTP